MKRLFLSLLLMLSCEAWSAGITREPERSAWGLGLEHARLSLEDGFDTVGWSILAGGLAGTIWAHQHDGSVRNSWRHNQKMGRSVSHFGATWGSGAPGLTIALIQLATDPRNGEAHAESLILTSATHISIAAIVQRGRPSKPDDWTSFPSGHTASAWATATSLSYAYGWRAALPSYAAALVTMGARLSDDKHWLSDTVAAATIGLFWGRATHFHEKDSRSSWVPFIDHKSAGLGVKHAF